MRGRAVFRVLVRPNVPIFRPAKPGAAARARYTTYPSMIFMRTFARSLSILSIILIGGVLSAHAQTRKPRPQRTLYGTYVNARAIRKVPK